VSLFKKWKTKEILPNWFFSESCKFPWINKPLLFSYSKINTTRSTQQDQHNKILHSKHTMLCNLNSLKAYITTSTITYTDNKHAREAIPEPSTKCCSAAAPPKTSPAFPFSTDTATPASVPTFPFTAES